MRVVLLYGPPGVGKLTVGTELAALTGFRLLHNHLSVNLVTAVFERRTEPWDRLLHQVRRDVFAACAAEGVDVITTHAFNGATETIAAWDWILEPLREAGGAVLRAQLVCDRDELFRRVQDDSRRAHDKLTDPAVLRQLFDGRDLFPTIPVAPHLRLDVTHLEPAEAARRIAEHYDLCRR